ncbi:MAG: hypothetical protein LBU17_02435 [Treponema sp.]|jgi:hypothetical protein|nr:hypothetical protein [Treponema sp.]
MTLSNRNNCLKAGILIAAGAMILMIIASFHIIQAYPDVSAGMTRRSTGILQFLVPYAFKPIPYVPFVSIISSVLYALITIISIYYFFEKTPSPEILFFAFFVISFAFEGSRIMVPLKLVYGFSNVYLIMASRVLFFGRYFGIFSLFVASVYAAGLEVQKPLNIIFIIALATLVITLGVPIDGLSWDSSLSMNSGYTAMFNMVETGIVLITMVSFFVSAYSRGTKAYIFISIGSFMVFLGRNILLNADTWISPVLGLLLLALGTRFICTELHQVYLWL